MALSQMAIAHRLDAGFRRGDLFGPSPCAHTRQGRRRARHAVVRGGQPVARPIPPGHRVVSLFPRSRVRRQELLEPFDVALRRDELRVGGGCLGAVGVDLRLGLVNVFDARAGTEKPQLRVGLTALGFRTGERQLGVGGVETREERQRPRVHLADAELEDPSPTGAET